MQPNIYNHSNTTSCWWISYKLKFHCPFWFGHLLYISCWPTLHKVDQNGKKWKKDQNFIIFITWVCMKSSYIEASIYVYMWEHLFVLQFHAQTKDSRRLTDKKIPFEYCYAMRSTFLSLFFLNLSFLFCFYITK